MPKKRNKFQVEDKAYMIDFFGQYGTPYAVYEVDANNTPIAAIFTPFEKQIQFFRSNSPYLLFGGGRGGGKSYADLWKAIFRCHLIPGARVIILRRTMPQLKKTILDEFLKIPKGLYEDYNATDKMVTFDNGSIIWFASADTEDAVRQYLSGNFDLILFDEQGEFTYSMWRFITGSCRTTIEQDIFGTPVTAQVAGTCNPGGVGGEFNKALFVDKKQVPGENPNDYKKEEYEFIQSLVDDNPYYAVGTKAGDAYRKMLMSQPARIREAWLKGKWDGFEGQYYDNFDPIVSTIGVDPLNSIFFHQYWQTKWISIDWGQVHHAYVSWHTKLEVTGLDGTKKLLVFTYREILRKGISEEALAQEIVANTPEEERTKVTKVYLSPETFGDSEFTRAKRMGNILYLNGLPRPTPANNNRVDGWRLMHSLIGERHILGGKEFSGWVISEACIQAIEAIPLLIHHPTIDGDVLKTNTVADDVGDGLRYGIASHIKAADKPFTERLNERLKDIEDPNQKYHTHLKMIEEEKKKSVGFVLRRNPRRR